MITAHKSSLQKLGIRVIGNLNYQDIVQCSCSTGNTAIKNLLTFLLTILFLFIYFSFIDSKEREREGERDGEKHQREREASISGCLWPVP